MKWLGKLALVAVAGTGATAIWASPGFEMSNDAALQEKVARSQVIREAGVADVQRVIHLREAAHRSRDVIRLNCINDKLVQMQPMLTVIEHQQAELRGNNPAVFADIVAKGESMRQLREEADRCGGEALLSSGTDSSNGFTAPIIPDNPYGAAWSLTEIEAPAYASPFN